MLNNFICIEDDFDKSACYINKDKITAIYTAEATYFKNQKTQPGYDMTVYTLGDAFTFTFKSPNTRSFYLRRILGVDD